MGVPKFYRWISERYPCLSEVVKEYQIPEFDNLYLDMNGIIHVCSHPNDNDPHFRMTEEKMFKDIFHYIEVLFRLIQPKNVFFMAVDGVAPRAKMNQQRGRRFRSAREAVDAEKKARDRGEVLPTEDRFDSNCITPGTEFMARLDAALQYFVTYKISQDKMWQNCRVIYSGHETPGEGEHKIMEYIRYTKSQPDYNPNTRHCLYGLDADLIMLGLTSHEPHFSLLREEVRFGGKNSNSRTPSAEETTFHLLHLSLMREYLNYEFMSVKSSLSFPFDLENIIDDWVLMGFLVGNDFIPHLPNLHINKDALPMLYQTYKEVLPTLDGYLNIGGKLHLRRFEKFIQKLADTEIEHFHETNADLKYFNSKKSGDGSAFKVNKGGTRSKELEPFEFGDAGDEKVDIRGAFQRMNIEPDPNFLDDEEDEGISDGVSNHGGSNGTFNEEFRQHKREYYVTKMHYEDVDAGVLLEQATCYVRGIQWILNYYYNGICSWSWYYPYHYAPFVSDVKGFSHLKLEYDMGKPFMPYEQLLAVLPPLSKKHLPESYRDLMTKDSSPVKDFYPEDFKTDLNGKQQDWEAVVLIPFIDEKRLLNAMAPCNLQLTEAQVKRNIHGPMYVCSYIPDNLGEYKPPPSFPSVAVNHCNVELLRRERWEILPEKIFKGLCKKAKQDLYFAGFPTLKHIPHKFHISKEAVKVFQQNSRSENFILDILEEDAKPDGKDLANQLLGKTVFVSWPHLVEAKVQSVATSSERYHIYKGEMKEQQLFGNIKEEVTMSKKSIATDYHDRWGINVGNTDILVYAAILTGRRYMPSTSGRISLEKSWSTINQPFAYQTIVRDIAVHDPGYKQHLTPQEYFPPRTKVFMLGQPHYGSMGEVIEIDPSHKGRIRVVMTVSGEPNFDVVKVKQDELNTRYLTGFQTAQKLGISSHLLARLTGTIFLVPSSGDNPGELENTRNKLNIGLNLKNNKRNEEVIGYTRKIRDENNGKTIWLYSPKTVEAIRKYQEAFPKVFDHLAVQVGERDIFFQEDVFGGENHKEHVAELTKWLKESDFAKAGRQKCGTPTIDELIMSRIVEEVDKVTTVCARAIKMQVRPHLLFKPNPLQGSTPPDPSVTYKLFDRVTNCREGFSVPLGAKGTVIGIHPADKVADIIYDILFDESFPEGLTFGGPTTANRCYRLYSASLINISHGSRLNSVGDADGNGDGDAKLPDNVWNNRRHDQQYSQQNSYSPRQSTDRQGFYPSGGQHRMQFQSPQESNWKTQGYNQSPQETNWRGQGFNQSPQESNWRGHMYNQKLTRNNPGFDSTSPQPPDPNQLPSPSGLYERMVEIRSASEVECIVYGSYYANWSNINKSGVSRMGNRNIMCFSCVPRSIPGPKAFQLLIFIHLRKALEDGIRFYKVNERQVACTGDKQGFIHSKYFIKVVDVESETIIFPARQAVGVDAIPTSSDKLLYGIDQPVLPGQGRGKALASQQPPTMRIYQNIWSQVQREESERVDLRPMQSQMLSKMLNIAGEESSKSDNGRTEVSVEDIFRGAMPGTNQPQGQAPTDKPNADILSLFACASQPLGQNAAEVNGKKADSPAKSAFVPTQVIRNRTPRKPRPGQPDDSTRNLPNPNGEEEGNSGAEAERPIVTVQGQKHQSQVPQQQQHHHHQGNGNGNRPKRQGRNRLAVKFGQPFMEDT